MSCTLITESQNNNSKPEDSQEEEPTENTACEKVQSETNNEDDNIESHVERNEQDKNNESKHRQPNQAHKDFPFTLESEDNVSTVRKEVEVKHAVKEMLENKTVVDSHEADDEASDESSSEDSASEEDEQSPHTKDDTTKAVVKNDQEVQLLNNAEANLDTAVENNVTEEKQKGFIPLIPISISPSSVPVKSSSDSCVIVSSDDSSDSDTDDSSDSDDTESSESEEVSKQPEKRMGNDGIGSSVSSVPGTSESGSKEMSVSDTMKSVEKSPVKEPENTLEQLPEDNCITCDTQESSSLLQTKKCESNEPNSISVKSNDLINLSENSAVCSAVVTDKLSQVKDSVIRDLLVTDDMQSVIVNPRYRAQNMVSKSPLGSNSDSDFKSSPTNKSVAPKDLKCVSAITQASPVEQMESKDKMSTFVLESPPSLNSSDLNNSSVETTPQTFSDCAQAHGNYRGPNTKSSSNYIETVNNPMKSPVNPQMTSPTLNQTFTVPEPSASNQAINFNMPTPSPSNKAMYNLPQPSPNNVLYGMPQPSPTSQNTNYSMPNPSPSGSQYSVHNPSPGNMPTPSPTNSNHSFNMATPSPNANSGSYNIQNANMNSLTGGGQQSYSMCSNSASVNYNPVSQKSHSSQSGQCVLPPGTANTMRKPSQTSREHQQQLHPAYPQNNNSCSLAKLQQLTNGIDEFGMPSEQISPNNMTPPPPSSVHPITPPPPHSMHRNTTPPTLQQQIPVPTAQQFTKFQRQRSNQKSPAPNVTVQPNMNFPQNMTLHPSYNVYGYRMPQAMNYAEYFSNAAGLYNQPNLQMQMMHTQHNLQQQMPGQPNNPAVYPSYGYIPPQAFNSVMRR